MDNVFDLLSNLHKSFMDLHNERMKEINAALEGLAKDCGPSDNSEALDQISKDLEELLK